jgi:hypothetical protein
MPGDGHRRGHGRGLRAELGWDRKRIRYASEIVALEHPGSVDPIQTRSVAQGLVAFRTTTAFTTAAVRVKRDQLSQGQLDGFTARDDPARALCPKDV